ncbi:hypothetical protein NDU88_002628 [Pleurodeles waltl]|uniref:Uncharacterized protein n=1 Tax=Pleurodeles waltl TaxID=8319 RepID=A0AAV7UW54_PLEWA|nr:hypothetical protein NDU88_002628 [Pleurodeles waltl]
MKSLLLRSPSSLRLIYRVKEGGIRKSQNQEVAESLRDHRETCREEERARSTGTMLVSCTEASEPAQAVQATIHGEMDGASPQDQKGSDLESSAALRARNEFCAQRMQILLGCQLLLR